MPAPRTSARPGTSARPVLSAREAQALREALVLRSALEAGQVLTPAQAAALRTATAAAVRTTSGAARTAARPASRRPASKGRPATKRAATRRRAATGERTGTAWSARLRVVALSTLLLPAVAALVLPGTGQDGSGGGPLDTTALALTAQSSLLEDAGRYRELEQEVARARTRLEQARALEQAAIAEVRAQQHAIGHSAAGLYRATPQQRYPLLGLSVRDTDATSGALLGQSVAERADQALTGTIVRTERSSAALAVAGDRVAQARSALEAVSGRADVVLATVRSAVDDLSPEITSALAGLGISTTRPQQQRDEHAMRRWQGYLAQLGAAGIEPPAAAELTDPENLPAGLSPALDAAGLPIPGLAWAVVGTSPVTVLPAETVAAVSFALSQLGKPFVPGSSGPDSYDCGGFTAASWLLAGYAVPTTPQDQWATGAAVPSADVQVGDLVYAPGGQDVGIYLGEGDVVGASAGTYQVSVRPMAAGSSATRVVLPAPAQANAPLPFAEAGACGAALPPRGERTAAWGGWSNGQIPTGALCRLGVHGHALRCDAAASYGQLDAAYRAAFGTPLCITDSYRSLASQISAFTRKPGLAAVPGTSNHGWALAVDLCGGIHVGGSAQWTWMTANAGRFGFVQPDWASPGGEKPEPWHWEYGYIS